MHEWAYTCVFVLCHFSLHVISACTVRDYPAEPCWVNSDHLHSVLHIHTLFACTEAALIQSRAGWITSHCYKITLKEILQLHCNFAFWLIYPWPSLFGCSDGNRHNELITWRGHWSGDPRSLTNRGGMWWRWCLIFPCWLWKAGFKASGDVITTLLRDWLDW